MSVQFLHPKFLTTWMTLGLMYLVSLLPYRSQIALGNICGFALRFLAYPRFRIAKINLSKCYPNYPKYQITKLAKLHFQSIGIGLFEISNSFFISEKRLKKRYRTVGYEYAKQVMDAGNNSILLTGHFTTMMICVRMLILEFPFIGIYRPQNNVLFDFMMQKRLRRFGIEMVSSKNIKHMIKSLKSGLPLWYAHDQDLGSRSCVFAPFFGIPTATITATARFASMPNTQIIPHAFWREPDGYVLKFSPPIENFPTGNQIADATTTNQILETQITNAPEQYGWIHRRFKTRPNGDDSFY